MSILNFLEASLRARRSVRQIMSVKGAGYSPLARLREYVRLYEQLMAQIQAQGPDGALNGAIGVWKLRVKADRIRNAILEGWTIQRYDSRAGELEAVLCNAFVDQGLQRSLDRMFGIGGPPGAISHIIISSDNAAVVAGTTNFGGIISAKAINPAATRVGNTTTAGANWTQADNPGPATFVVRKVGLQNAAADGNAFNIIGGAGVAPYNKPFTLDLTTVGNFNQTLQNQVTLVAV